MVFDAFSVMIIGLTRVCQRIEDTPVLRNSLLVYFGLQVQFIHLHKACIILTFV